MKALKMVYPDYDEAEEPSGRSMNYPRPISEPPSPSSSRATTPAPSEQGSSDDEVDSEAEVSYIVILFSLSRCTRQYLVFY